MSTHGRKMELLILGGAKIMGIANMQTLPEPLLSKSEAVLVGKAISSA